MFILSVSLLNAQDVSELDVIKIIEKDFLEIPKDQLERLVPFNDSSSRTGLMDFKTHKIIVPARYFELDFFKPNVKGNYNGIYLFEYNPETKKIDIHLDSESVPEMDSANSNSQNKDIRAEMNGFSLTDDKKLKNYSNSYSSFSEDLFFYNNKHYGIAVRDEKYGIVDQDGKPLPGFDFNYDKLVLNVYSKMPNLWFKFLKADGTSGYINQKGEVKFVNEFKTIFSPKTSTSIYCASASEEFSYNGYEILYSDEGAAGILDLENMKWVVKSSKEREVIEINYASNKKIENIKKDRRNLKMYFLMYDKKLDKKYFIDENHNEYKYAK